MKKLENKIKELEKRIEQLERRPIYYPVPCCPPQQPVSPTYPTTPGVDPYYPSQC